MYLPWTLSSSWFCLRLRTNLTNQYVLLIQLFSYANETVYLLGNLPFFKIHVNCFMAQDDSPCVDVISKHMLWPGATLSLETFPFSS